ncbi:MAG: RNA polymerase II transcription factor B subunit 4 [Lichina confinis]|nr:MAG: RNA polymerase II transcription factor B subunit 4 [Lichina confinis]
MNAVDGSEHYEHHPNEPSPSLLAIVLDTNPAAWACLADTLPLSKAVANILVFINAHLAFNYANQVAVIASHCNKAQWLYPPGQALGRTERSRDQRHENDDVEMEDAEQSSSALRRTHDTGRGKKRNAEDEANKYRPFRQVEEAVLANLQDLIDSTNAKHMQPGAGTTMMAGALTVALAYINRQALDYAESNGGAASSSATAGEMGDSRDAANGGAQGLQSRILVVSVSRDVASQYIPVMNCIFAAQRKRIPIDVLKLSSNTTFLQQGSDATRGIYMHLDSPLGILQYLMMAFLPDQTARRHLILPTQVDVDFRAACFCHKRVVDIGFVCSICLSIFCEPPPNADCLTCGTHLHLGDYGAKPAVLPRGGANATKKKKKKDQKKNAA